MEKTMDRPNIPNVARGIMHDVGDLTALENAVEEQRAKGDDRAALAAIARSWPTVSTEDGVRLRAIIESIPHEEWTDDPWIFAAMGASYRSINTRSRSAALPWFRSAQALLENDADAAVSTRAGIDLHHSAALRTMGRFQSAFERAEGARLLLDDDLTMRPSLRVRAQAKTALQLGLIEMHLGRYGSAITHLRLAFGLEPELTRSEFVECCAGIALHQYSAGEFTTALTYVARARVASADTGLINSRFGAAALIAELLVAIEQNRLDDALSLAPLVAAASAKSDWEALGHYAIGAMSVISGRHIEGLDHLAKALEVSAEWEGTPRVRAMSEGMRGVLFMHLGEINEALAIFERVESTANHANCSARFVAGIRFAAGDYTGTLEALAGCEDLGNLHSKRTLVDVQLLKAAANYELGNTVLADITFDRALLSASQKQMRTPFLIIPPDVMQRMLGRASDRSQPDAVHSILDDLQSGHGSPLRGAVDPLSSRELDIARQLYLDKTINQIAAELFISSNTVKTHVRSIYRKLDASNRKEAMRRVRELGLHLEITPF